MGAWRLYHLNCENWESVHQTVYGDIRADDTCTVMICAYITFGAARQCRTEDRWLREEAGWRLKPRLQAGQWPEPGSQFAGYWQAMRGLGSGEVAHRNRYSANIAQEIPSREMARRAIVYSKRPCRSSVLPRGGFRCSTVARHRSGYHSGIRYESGCRSP